MTIQNQYHNSVQQSVSQEEFDKMFRKFIYNPYIRTLAAELRIAKEKKNEKA